MKKLKSPKRLQLDPRQTLALVATTGYRKAAKKLHCSRGKLYDIRKANGDLYDDLRFRINTVLKSGKDGKDAAEHKYQFIPTVWKKVAMYYRALVANEYEAVMIRLNLGLSLLRVKKHLGHGDFLVQLPMYCNVTERSAERYMLLAKHLIPEESLKSDTVSNLNQLPMQVLGEVKAKVGSKKVSTLYQELGITKKKKPKHEASSPGIQAESVSPEAIWTSLGRLDAKLEGLSKVLPAQQARFKEVRAALLDAKSKITTAFKLVAELEGLAVAGDSAA